MELMELYNQVKNPIEDPKVIEKLINAYAKSSKNFGGFYTQITKCVDKNRTPFVQADFDKFYSMMFNKWKNSIVALKREQFDELYKKGSYGQDFIKMRNFLKKIPDVTTKKEADDILEGKHNDKELEDAIKRYSWTAFGIPGEFVHVCSRYVTAKQDKYPNDVEHRLYLDTELLDTYKMINLLVEKCDEHHLPYYFKFDQFGDRNDTVVIYSSTENLTKYVEILQEIKKEHPDLVARAKEPPVLTGKIDGWIGYGSEPAKSPDGEKQSFNLVRSKAIESAIEKTTKKWIMEHRNMQITYQGQKLSFQDYIAMKSTERMIEKLEKSFLYDEKEEIKKAQITGKTYNQNDVVARLGYTLQEVRSSVVKDNIYKVIRAQMGACLTSVCNGTARDMTTIEMNVRNGKKIKFGGYLLEEIIKDLSVQISEKDLNFKKNVHSAIVDNSRQYGIDPDKFCFDIKARESMRQLDAQMHTKLQSRQSNPIIDISFEQLRDYYSKYELILDEQNILTKDRKTGELITDPNICTIANFANIWAVAAGLTNEGIYEKYAFSDAAKYTYDYMKVQCKKQLVNDGKISPMEVYNSVKELNHGTSKEIVPKLFGHPMQPQIVNDFFKLGTPNAKPYDGKIDEFIFYGKIKKVSNYVGEIETLDINETPVNDVNSNKKTSAIVDDWEDREHMLMVREMAALRSQTETDENMELWEHMLDARHLEVTNSEIQSAIERAERKFKLSNMSKEELNRYFESEFKKDNTPERLMELRLEMLANRQKDDDIKKDSDDATKSSNSDYSGPHLAQTPVVPNNQKGNNNQQAQNSSGNQNGQSQSYTYSNNQSGRKFDDSSSKKQEEQRLKIQPSNDNNQRNAEYNKQNEERRRQFLVNELMRFGREELQYYLQHEKDVQKRNEFSLMLSEIEDRKKQQALDEQKQNSSQSHYHGMGM